MAPLLMNSFVLFFFLPDNNTPIELYSMPVESGHNYDIEIAKDLVKVWDKDKGEFIPIMQLPEDCSVQNELVQDFGRVIFVKIPLILIFFLWIYCSI